LITAEVPKLFMLKQFIHSCVDLYFTTLRVKKCKQIHKYTFFVKGTRTLYVSVICMCMFAK